MTGDLSSPPELLFDFSVPETVQRFAAVDDRIMGGVSRSALRASSGIAVFEGELSLEQNGGFASVRSDAASVDLSESVGIALRVRGDGRTYKLRMRTDARFDGVSYQASFPTSPGAWTMVHLPFEVFRPTYRGQFRSDADPFDPAKVMSFGLLVAGEQVGAFRLEIGWIRALSEL